jgi:Kef-type K+ transport system membrane component KefB
MIILNSFVKSSVIWLTNSWNIPQTTFHRLLSAGTGIFNGTDPLEAEINLFLVQATIIIGICRVLGVMGSYIHQPKVIFEIIGGILLGPSAIGKDENFLETVFPAESLSYLSLISEFGLLLYLFIVGLELDIDKLKTHAKRAGSIALMGMAIPFALGIAISQTLFDNLEGFDPAYEDVKPSTFFVFIGTAMSITAFPVLARILKESGLIYTRAGALTLGAAALNDAVAWCLLILAISLANAGDLNTAGYVFGVVVGIAVFILLMIRPLFEKIVRHLEAYKSPIIRSNLFTFTLLVLFMAAWTTSLIGLDVIFGAFIFGLAVPRDTQLFKDCNDHIEEFVLTLLLPLYFALSGLKTDVTQINTPSQGAMVVLVCVVASFGKFIGAGVTAFASGVSARESAAVAVLMNTRGLVELIVLNLGLNSGILNTKTFSVMVIMCLFTTFITNPLIELIYPPHLRILAQNEYDEKVLLDDNKGNSSEAERKQQDGMMVSEAMYFTTKNIFDLASFAKVCLLVDRLEHLQGIMNFFHHLQPSKSDTSLSLLIMKFEEPSYTDKDHFLGLSEDRLIRVVHESTDIRSLITPDISKPLPQLLPLSMCMKALGAKVDVLNIFGDPQEFASELKIHANQHMMCDYIFFPWRASKFIEQFFWSSLKKVACPIALYVQCDVTVPNLPEGRQRGNSLFQSLSASNNNASSSPYVNLSAENSENLNSSTDKIRTVLVLITGAYTDITVISMILRMLESSASVFATILVVDGRKDFPVVLKNALHSFYQRISAMTEDGRVKIIKLQDVFIFNHHSNEKLHQEVIKDISYDLFVHSYLEVELYNEDGEEKASNTHLPPRGSFQQRSLTLLPTNLSITERREDFLRVVGAPEDVTHSSLEQPELGGLGSRLYDLRVFAKMLIFHEAALTVTKRKNYLASMKGNPVKELNLEEESDRIGASPSYTSLFGYEEQLVGGTVDKVPFTPRKAAEEKLLEATDVGLEISSPPASPPAP